MPSLQAEMRLLGVLGWYITIIIAVPLDGMKLCQNDSFSSHLNNMAFSHRLTTHA